MDRITINISDYSKEFKKLFDNKDMITTNELLAAIEELLYKNEDLEEEIRKLKNIDYDEYIPEDYIRV